MILPARNVFRIEKHTPSHPHQLTFRQAASFVGPPQTGNPRMIPASWPYTPEIYEAFAAISRAGFTLYCCGDRHAPHVLVAVYDWGNYIDILNIRGADRVTAARVPTYDGLDIFAPSHAVWHYLGTLEPTVAALLRLPAPHHPHAPTTTYPAPATLFVSRHEQRPMTIKPGKPTM